MGAGMYGLNGIHPEVSIKLWNTYALPRLVHGLELCRLTQLDISRLENCQRQVLRNIQNLPASTATAGIHLLSGVLPVQAIIERNSLTLFRNLVSLQGSREREILGRQLAMKNPESASWIIHIKNLLAKYDLPSAYDIYDQPVSKYQWKKIVKTKVTEYWYNKICNDAEDKTTLKYLNTKICYFGRLHPLWSRTPYTKIDIPKACVKARMLTSRYHTQEDLNKYRRTNDPCLLCKKDPENLLHMLFLCPELQLTRNNYVHKLQDIITDISTPENWTYIAGNDDLLLKLILDPTTPEVNCPQTEVYQIEALTRSMVFALHAARTSLLKKCAMT